MDGQTRIFRKHYFRLHTHYVFMIPVSFLNMSDAQTVLGWMCFLIFLANCHNLPLVLLLVVFSCKKDANF